MIRAQSDEDLVCTRAIEAGLVDSEAWEYITSAQDSVEEMQAFARVGEKLSGLCGGSKSRSFNRPYSYGGPRGFYADAVWDAFVARARTLKDGNS